MVSAIPAGIWRTNDAFLEMPCMRRQVVSSRPACRPHRAVRALRRGGDRARSRDRRRSARARRPCSTPSGDDARRAPGPIPAKGFPFPGIGKRGAGRGDRKAAPHRVADGGPVTGRRAARRHGRPAPTFPDEDGRTRYGAPCRRSRLHELVALASTTETSGGPRRRCRGVGSDRARRRAGVRAVAAGRRRGPHAARGRRPGR